MDYWFISNNLQDWTKSTDIIPASRKDHSSIMLVVEDNELMHAKGQGFWKMNCAILDDFFLYRGNFKFITKSGLQKVKKNCLTIEASGNGQSLT